MPTPNLTPLLDAGRTLFGELGTFWAGIYQGSDLVFSLCSARHQAELQTDQLHQELSDCAGVHTVPLLSRSRWLPLTIVRDDVLSDTRLTYTDDDVWGETSTTLANRTHDYSLPANVREVPVLMDQLLTPTAWLTDGVDYVYDTGQQSLRFFIDPFADDRFTPDTTYDDEGAESGRSLTLWGFWTGRDHDYLQEHHGYVQGTPVESTTPSRTYCGAVRNGLTRGPSVSDLTTALSGLCDAPICLTDGEVVLDVAIENTRRLVLTTDNVYICGVDAEVGVIAGDTLVPGAPLTDAFAVIELSPGTPTPSTLASLTLPTHLLDIAASASLTFNNESVPLQVTTVSGRTRVEFDLDGATADKTLFWDTCHTRGTVVGATSLAQSLDTRPSPQTTEPDAGDLPVVINPLEFLVENVLRYGLIVVKMNPDSFGPHAATTAVRATVLRQLTGPHGYLIEI